MTKARSRSRPSHREHKFAAFDYTADDERVEKDSRIILSKFKKKRSPQKCNSPVSKYTFLSLFARGERNIQNDFGNEVVDIDSSDGLMDEGIIKSDTVVSPCSSICKPSERNQTEYHGSECSSRATTYKSVDVCEVMTGDKHVCQCLPLSPADNDLVVVDSDDDTLIDLRSSKSPSIAQLLGSLEEQPLKYSSNAHDTEALVVVLPDHIIYGDFISGSSCLTFSPKCIELEGSSISDTTRHFTFKWMVSAIADIQFMWCDVMKTAMLELHLKSETSRNPDEGVLSFAVHDPDWSDRQKAIQSLDNIYKVIWRTVEVETMRNELSLGQKSSGESFDEVLYPKGDPDAISISKRDVDRLQPETFINDTIIDFYIMYLKNNIHPEEKRRFHFFNCFFFRKLTDLDKDPSRACEGRAAFQRVRRWTMKVDIFRKDYIFVPINFSLHWSLIVICHPGEVAGYRDDEMEKPSRVPCILHMDSLRGSHKGLKNLLQSYLLEEWKERHGELAEDVSKKFLNLPFVRLKLPQQDNLFDCGLFLLHYIELFLEQAPVNFSPFSIKESSKFLREDWFQPEEVTHKRDRIRKLIYEILKHSRDNCSADCDYKYSSNSINESNASMEFIKEVCSSSERSQINDLHSPADTEVHIVSPPQTPIKGLKFAGVSDLGYRDSSLRGDTPKSATFNNNIYSGQKLTSHGSKIMSPIEEEEETGKEFMDFSPALRERSQQNELLASCPVNENIKLSFGMKTAGSSVSSQVCPGEVEAKPSSSGEEFTDCVVVDSQDENDTCVDIHDTEEHSFRQNTNTSFFCNAEADSTEHEQSFIQEEQAAINSEEYADCIVLDSQDENCTCVDIRDTAQHFFRNPEVDSTECVAERVQSSIQKEKQGTIRRRHLPEIIEVSGSEMGNDEVECFSASSAESAACIVEDSEEDECNNEERVNCVQPLLRSNHRSRKTHLKRMIIDLTEDLHSKQFL